MNENFKNYGNTVILMVRNLLLGTGQITYFMRFSIFYELNNENFNIIIKTNSFSK